MAVEYFGQLPPWVLGLVSQSGGLPTGGLIERGANANGEYVRFADGTQICSTVDVVVPFTGVTSLQSAVVTLPAAFVNNAYNWTDTIVTGSGGANHRLGMFVPSSPTTTTITARYLTTSTYPYTAGDTRTIRMTLFGRWF
jgi:hypothetical protein